MNDQSPSGSPPPDRPLLHGVDWAVASGATDEVMLGARRRFRRRRQQRMATLGVVGTLVIGAFVWRSNFTRADQAVPVAASSATLTTPTRQILPDGSIAELKDGAVIAVAYSSTARRVILQRGEAHFQVKKDPAHPFIVAVDSVEVRAVGTSFSVQRGITQVEVVVTNGRVAVDRIPEPTAADQAPGTPGTIAMLDAGNRTVVAVAANPTAPVVEPVGETEMAQRLAWRIPRLEFTRTPLAEAVAMINQHGAINLSLADSSLANVRISGLLRVDNVDSLLRLLETEHGIKAERIGATDVVLHPRR